MGYEVDEVAQRDDTVVWRRGRRLLDKLPEGSILAVLTLEIALVREGIPSDFVLQIWSMLLSVSGHSGKD